MKRLGFLCWSVAAAGLLLTFGGCTRVRDPPREPDGARSPTASASVAPLDSIVAEGQAHYDESEYARARAVWLIALERTRTERNVAAEAQVLTNLALASWHLGEFREARQLGEAAVELELRGGLRNQLPRSYNALGLLAWDQGRLGEAVELFRQTMAAAKAAGDPRYVYRPAGNLGSVYTQFGEFARARHYLLTGLKGAREHGDGRTEGRVLSNLAVLQLRVGDVRAALRWLEEARAVARAAGDATNEELILAQLADAHSLLGEPGRAFSLLDSALRQARAQGRPQAEAANLELQAALYRQAGDYTRALEIYARARAINSKLGLTEEMGRDLRNEAEIHFELENLDLAERYAVQALGIHRRIGARPPELADYLLLAELAEARGRRGSADEYLAAARRLARVLRSRSARIDAALAEARVMHRRGDAPAALLVLDGIVEDVTFSGYAVESEVHALRARALARLGQLKRAAEAGRRAVAAVERIRGRYGSGVLRTSYVANRQRVYTDLVGVLLKLGRTEEGFQVADAGRGRVALEHVVEAGRASAEGMRERETVLRRIAELASGIASAEAVGRQTEAAQLSAKLREARREFEGLLLTANERAGPNDVLLGGAALDAGSVRGSLRRGEAIIEYLVSDDRLLAFVVTLAGVRSFETAVAAEDLESRIRLARGLMAHPGATAQQVAPVLAALNALLLGEVRGSGVLDGVQRLFVVPHGGLNYLPFAALRDHDTGRYLVQDYSVLYLPTAAALPVLRSSVAAAAEPETVLAAAVVFAPQPEALPASRAEARSVARTLRRARVYLGRRATEARLREALSGVGMVHVASHGVMNVASPMFSRIELAAIRGAPPEDDGRLEVHEVLGLGIRSPLVFLSGCETGLGGSWSTAFAPGEDYATLERAFLYAGARNVVATLWPVEDAGAAEFATAFYDRLGQPDAARALAEAQQAMLAHARYGHPYYWAGYRLAGLGEWAPGAQKRPAPSVSLSRGARPSREVL